MVLPSMVLQGCSFSAASVPSVSVLVDLNFGKYTDCSPL